METALYLGFEKYVTGNLSTDPPDIHYKTLSEGARTRSPVDRS